MRLTLSALLCAALIASPALAHDHDGPPMPPPGADMPPPPPPPGYAPYAAPMDPRWEHMRGDWRERCGDRGDRHHHRRDRDGRDGPAYHDDCGYPAPPMPYGYPGAYPGAYMGYAVPMVMVPVLRNKPCKEVVEEIVEEVPVRRRVIRPRARPVRVVHDKRVPMTPSKRIAY